MRFQFGKNSSGESTEIETDERASEGASRRARESSRIPLFAMAAALIVLFGVWLRVDRMTLQAPFHDERHTLAAVARLDAAELATSFGAQDHSIPISLYLKLLTRLDALDELLLWGPVAVGAVLAILALAALTGKETDAESGWVLAALLSTSPLLVYFARIARPYAWTGPLALIAVLLLARAWRRGGRRLAWGWAVITALIGWSMPVHLPFALLPAAALWIVARIRRDRDRARFLLGSFLLAGILLVAALAPPLISDSRALVSKSGAPMPGLWTMLNAARMMAGLGSFVGLALMTALAAAGVRLLLRRGDRLLVGVLAVASGAQLAALLATRPASFDHSAIVAARYLLPAGMALLFAAALAAGAIARRRRAGGAIVAAALWLAAAAIWVPAAPLLADRVDNFRSTRLYHLQFFPSSRLQRDFAHLPPAYAPLAAAGPGAVVEAPYDGALRTPYPYYQRLHHREVFVAIAPPQCSAGVRPPLAAEGERGFHLSRLVSLADPQLLRAQGARFVILHRDVEAEVPWVTPKWRWPNRFSFRRCIAELERLTGTKPTVAGGIALFDLGPLADAVASPPNR